MLWALATVFAAAVQTARNAMQSSLTVTLGTLGATQVRFIYGLPFAALFLIAASELSGAKPPSPTPQFFVFVTVGAVAQIFGTALLLAAMRLRSFSVVTAFSKTEPVQVALFGLVVLGEGLTALRAAAIFIATLGVVLVGVKPGERFARGTLKPMLLGVASGTGFAIASVGFRGAILALPEAPFFMSATTTLLWSLVIQVVLLVAWMAVFARRALLGSLIVWRRSLFAGFLSAFASQFWFLGMSLTAAANVRTLALVEVLFAQAVARRVFHQRLTPREMLGVALVVAGAALLLLAV